MPIAAGQLLLHYRLVEQIGEGGMGVVWRATDTTLDRDVAIKLLPPDFAADPDRLARFEREAKLLAALNHPNIAALHSVHDHDGTRFLAMELVGGEDLQQLIGRGPVAVDEAADIIRQIAEALEAAHERGVVHRDLKPANVRITPSGVVKVLDFGLAKFVAGSEDAAFRGQSSGTSVAVGRDDSPTMMSPAMTEAGMILGTATYMSPEQARGRPVDARTDIWALGCVAYELVTALRPFDGPTVTDTLAAIVKGEPDWSLLPAGVPPHLVKVMRRCLQKDPRKRVQHAGDIRLELENPDPIDSAVSAAATPSRGPLRSLAVLATLLVGLVGGALAARALWTSPAAPPDVPRHFDLDLAYPLDVSGIPRRKLALSPDGLHLAFVGRTVEGSEIRLRALGERDSVAVPGSAGGHSPFFSPDGRWVAFFAQGQLRKAPVEGGASATVCEAAGGVFGGTWSTDDTIVFATNVRNIMRVSASQGGEPTPVEITDVTNDAFIWPHFIPGTRHLLVSALTGVNGQPGPIVVAISADGGPAHVVTRGVDARYLPTGHLLYQLDGTVFAARFDPERLELTGPPVPISRDIAIDNVGAITAGISDAGLLVYEAPGEQRANKLLWVDRTGRTTPITAETRPFAVPRISPSGDRLVWGGLIAETYGDVWMLDLATTSMSRVTFESLNAYPAWTPDGARVAYTSIRDGSVYALYLKGVDDDSPPVAFGSTRNTSVPGDFSATGVLIYYEVAPATERDIWALSLEGGEPIPVLVTEHNERSPRFSPDGRWFAYVSDESGTDEVYVRPYPSTGSRWKVSIDGGREPAWNPAGGELFYRNGEAMMAAGYRVGPDGSMVLADRPRELFRGSFLFDSFGNANYAVAPDGTRFVMIEGPETGPAQLRVITNWFEELRRAEQSSGGSGR